MSGMKTLTSSSRLERIPAPAWLIAGAAFHYLGPACAVLLFPRLGVIGVATARIGFAALLFACWGNPWAFWRTAPPPLRWTVLALGTCLAAMNVSFYMALDRAPLSFVAALELTGSLVVALAALRSRRNLIAFACAAVGASHLVQLQAAHSLAGIVWSTANAVLWVLYLLLAHRVARSGAASASLGASMTVAALWVLPFGAAHLAPLADPLLLAAAFGVALASSVIPYLCDQQAMKRVSRAHFALMLTILPAWAVAVGAVVLRQVPGPQEWVGIGLVIAGLSLHRAEREETACNT